MDALTGLNQVSPLGGGSATSAAFLLGQLSGLGAANDRLNLGSINTGTLDPTTRALVERAQIQEVTTVQLARLLTALMNNGSQQGQQGQQNGNCQNCNQVNGVSGGGDSSQAGSSGGSSQAGGANGASGTGNAPPAETKDQGEIKQFIQQAASAYGADPKVLEGIAQRESGFKADAVNNWDSNAQKGTPSKGMFQFIESTFKSMAPKAKAANPSAWAGLGEPNWLDWRHQALTCAWAITHGQGSAWTTYKAAGGK